MATSPWPTKRVADLRHYALLLLLFSVACGAPALPPEPGVVARIDTLRIVHADVQAFATRVSADGELDSRRQSYLRGLMARHLLERESRNQGLDTLPMVRMQAEIQWQGRMRERYRRDVLWRNLEISEVSIQAYFDSLGLSRQRQVFGILLETLPQAEAAQAELLHGRAFDEVAHEHSTHRSSAMLGGKLGYISQPQARQLQIPDSLFAGLPDGALSPVLQQGDRFQIIRFDGRREAALEEHRIQIRNILKTAALARAEQQRLDELAVEHHWQVQPEGMQVLERKTAATQGVQPWQLDAEEAAEPLFSYDGGVICVGQYVQALASAGKSTTGTDGSSLLVAAVVENFRTAALFFEAARRAGLGDNDDDRRWRQQLLVELSIKELRRRVLREGEGVSSADVQKFYDTYQETFREADEIVILEAHVDSLTEAEDIVAAVRSGVPLAELAAAHTKRGESLWQAKGVLRMGHKERLQMPELYAGAQQAEQGPLIGPLEVDGGYSVFEVLDRQRGIVPEFARVEPRARALASRQRESEQFEAFIDELLKKYDDLVSVYPEELVRALPDSLLKRLSAG